MILCKNLNIVNMVLADDLLETYKIISNESKKLIELDNKIAKEMEYGEKFTEFNCPICFTESDSGVKMTNCDHGICFECFKEFMNQIKSGSIKNECPVENCHTVVNQNDIKKHINKETADKIEGKMFSEFLMKNEGKACIYKNCNNWVITDDKVWKCTICNH